MKSSKSKITSTSNILGNSNNEYLDKAGEDIGTSNEIRPSMLQSRVSAKSSDNSHNEVKIREPIAKKETKYCNEDDDDFEVINEKVKSPPFHIGSSKSTSKSKQMIIGKKETSHIRFDQSTDASIERAHCSQSSSQAYKKNNYRNNFKNSSNHNSNNSSNNNDNNNDINSSSNINVFSSIPTSSSVTSSVPSISPPSISITTSLHPPILLLIDLNGTLICRSRTLISGVPSDFKAANTYYYFRKGYLELFRELFDIQRTGWIQIAFYTSMTNKYASPAVEHIVKEVNRAKLFSAARSGVGVAIMKESIPYLFDQMWNKWEPSPEEPYGYVRDLQKLWQTPYVFADKRNPAFGFSDRNTIMIDDTTRKMKEFPDNLVQVSTFDENSFMESMNSAAEMERLARIIRETVALWTTEFTSGSKSDGDNRNESGIDEINSIDIKSSGGGGNVDNTNEKSRYCIDIKPLLKSVIASYI